jgi:flagellar motor switch protein FliM
MVPSFDRETRAVAPIIEEMFLNVARRMRARLATSTGLDAPITVKGVRPTGLANLLEGEAWAEAALWATYAVEGAPEPVVVALDGPLLNRIIGPLLGQGGVDDPGAASTPRPITPVDLRIGARLAADLVDSLEASWMVGVAPVLRFTDAAPSRRVCSDLDPSLTFAVCSVEIALGGQPLGSAHVALPNGLVRRLLPRALGGAGAAAPDKSSSSRGAPRPAQFDRVMPVEVEVAVELARITIPLKRLEQLRVGDEVVIGRAGEAIARIGDLAVFAGEAGASGAVRSVRVTTKMISDLSSEATDR